MSSEEVIEPGKARQRVEARPLIPLRWNLVRIYEKHRDGRAFDHLPGHRPENDPVKPLASGILRWLGDETLLQNLVAGLPVSVLLVVIVVCILLPSKGADWMIDGVVSLARRTDLSRIVIGATIVSLGTTTPEAFVSVMAAWMGDPGIALGNGARTDDRHHRGPKRPPRDTVGNIVGVDVLNCFFVIGAAGAARPLAIPPNFFFFHFPTMLIILYSSRAIIFLSKDGAFRRWHGAWLLGIYPIYVILQHALNIGTVER
jgi:cation:H+ antiporter